MKLECPWCEETVKLGVDVDANFEFKLVPTWDHPRSACCNLCEAEILEPCEMVNMGDDDVYQY